MIVVVPPSTVKSPCTLTPLSFTVNSVLPDAVTVTAVPLQVTFVVPDKIEVVEIPPTWSSTYYLLANSPSAVGAVVVLNVNASTPVIAFDDAVKVISPTSRPLLTLKLRVVMVHSPS